MIMQNIYYFRYLRLELDDALANTKKAEVKTEPTVGTADSEIPTELKKVFVIYEQAFKRIRDIKFIIELLNITQEYEGTEKLQNKILRFVAIYPNIF